MTSIAGNILVPAQQRKLGIGPVIEDQLLPLFGAVALGAHLAIASIVRIIDQMAADTLFRRVLIVIVRVTQLAVQIPVLARERVFRIEIMVEGLLAPALLVMAGITLLTKLSLVGIIGFVAIETE